MSVLARTFAGLQEQRRKRLLVQRLLVEEDHPHLRGGKQQGEPKENTASADRSSASASDRHGASSNADHKHLSISQRKIVEALRQRYPTALVLAMRRGPGQKAAIRTRTKLAPWGKPSSPQAHPTACPSDTMSGCAGPSQGPLDAGLSINITHSKSSRWGSSGAHQAPAAAVSRSFTGGGFADLHSNHQQRCESAWDQNLFSTSAFDAADLHGYGGDTGMALDRQPAPKQSERLHGNGSFGAPLGTWDPRATGVAGMDARPGCSRDAESEFSQAEDFLRMKDMMFSSMIEYMHLVDQQRRGFSQGGLDEDDRRRDQVNRYLVQQQLQREMRDIWANGDEGVLVGRYNAVVCSLEQQQGMEMSRLRSKLMCASLGQLLEIHFRSSTSMSALELAEDARAALGLRGASAATVRPGLRRRRGGQHEPQQGHEPGQETARGQAGGLPSSWERLVEQASLEEEMVADLEQELEVAKGLGLDPNLVKPCAALAVLQNAVLGAKLLAGSDVAGQEAEAGRCPDPIACAALAALFVYLGFSYQDTSPTLYMRDLIWAPSVLYTILAHGPTCLEQEGFPLPAPDGLEDRLPPQRYSFRHLYNVAACAVGLPRIYWVQLATNAALGKALDRKFPGLGGTAEPPNLDPNHPSQAQLRGPATEVRERARDYLAVLFYSDQERDVGAQARGPGGGAGTSRPRSGVSLEALIDRGAAPPFSAWHIGDDMISGVDESEVNEGDSIASTESDPELAGYYDHLSERDPGYDVFKGLLDLPDDVPPLPSSEGNIITDSDEAASLSASSSALEEDDEDEEEEGEEGEGELSSVEEGRDGGEAADPAAYGLFDCLWEPLSLETGAMGAPREAWRWAETLLELGLMLDLECGFLKDDLLDMVHEALEHAWHAHQKYQRSLRRGAPGADWQQGCGLGDEPLRWAWGIRSYELQCLNVLERWQDYLGRHQDVAELVDKLTAARSLEELGGKVDLVTAVETLRPGLLAAQPKTWGYLVARAQEESEAGPAAAGTGGGRLQEVMLLALRGLAAVAAMSYKHVKLHVPECAAVGFLGSFDLFVLEGPEDRHTTASARSRHRLGFAASVFDLLPVAMTLLFTPSGPPMTSFRPRLLSRGSLAARRSSGSGGGDGSRGRRYREETAGAYFDALVFAVERIVLCAPVIEALNMALNMVATNRGDAADDEASLETEDVAIEDLALLADLFSMKGYPRSSAGNTEGIANGLGTRGKHAGCRFASAHGGSSSSSSSRSSSMGSSATGPGAPARGMGGAAVTAVATASQRALPDPEKPQPLSGTVGCSPRNENAPFFLLKKEAHSSEVVGALLWLVACHRGLRRGTPGSLLLVGPENMALVGSMVSELNGSGSACREHLVFRPVASAELSAGTLARQLRTGPIGPPKPGEPEVVLLQNVQLGLVPGSDDPKFSHAYEWETLDRDCSTFKQTPTSTAVRWSEHLKKTTNVLVKKRMGVAWILSEGVEGAQKALVMAAKVCDEMDAERDAKGNPKRDVFMTVYRNDPHDRRDARERSPEKGMSVREELHWSWWDKVRDLAKDLKCLMDLEARAAKEELARCGSCSGVGGTAATSVGVRSGCGGSLADRREMRYRLVLEGTVRMLRSDAARKVEQLLKLASMPDQAVRHHLGLRLRLTEYERGRTYVPVVAFGRLEAEKRRLKALMETGR